MEPEQIHEFLRSRRSIRRFLPDAVPLEVLNRIVETAGYAPSAHNRQPWRVVNVVSQEARRRLADSMGKPFYHDLIAGCMNEADASEQAERSRRRIMEAPVLLVICFDTNDVDEYPDDKRRQGEALMGRQSTALFGGTLLLAAHAEGLGGVWVCAPLFAPQEVRLALDLPSHWEPQGMIFLGKPDSLQIPKPRRRKSVTEITKEI